MTGRRRTPNRGPATTTPAAAPTEPPEDLARLLDRDGVPPTEIARRLGVGVAEVRVLLTGRLPLDADGSEDADPAAGDSPDVAPDAPHGAPSAPALALRAPEAARALGVGVRHLWTLTKAGEVPHVRLGTTVVYPVGALEEWLARRARASTRRTSK
ncbi:MAG: helix-turn-helix domain-containing protein [Planctomycetota bacterium JB042]